MSSRPPLPEEREGSSRYDSFSTPEGRLKSFFQLKLQLESIQQCSDAVERSHQVELLSRDEKGARNAFLGLLSVFRRPRSIACIRAMTERWGISVSGGDDCAGAAQIRSIRAAVDGLIRRQIVLGEDLGDNEPFGMLHEGGSIWLFRDGQLAMYGVMTDSLSVTKWIISYFLKPDGAALRPKEAAHTISDGLIGVSLHTEASRVYYADTFMPTHDLDAFYEYLYHRCWSIRTLSLLIGILSHTKLNTDTCFRALSKLMGETYESVAKPTATVAKTPPDLLPALRALSVLLPLPKLAVQSQGASCDAAAQGSVDCIKDSGALLNVLKSLRLHSLTTLNGALKRQERFLRMSVTADTLQGWIGQMELVVLPEIDGSLFREQHDDKSFPDQLDCLKRFLKQLKDRVDRVDIPSSVGLLEKERDAKKRQNDACFLWTGLDLDEAERPWIDKRRAESLIDLNPDDRHGRAARRKDRMTSVNSARKAALDYEWTLRQSTQDRYEDARHRSCALSLLACCEYLLGHFRQAQHRLDLASGGLSNSPLHSISRSLICTYRAELLVYSADDHYEQLLSSASRGSVSGLDVAKELRKIIRADQEMRMALQLVGVAENLTRWRCLAHLGFGHVQLERMLFESEQIFARRKTISRREFSRKFGMFEQILLCGLRNLRTTLDLLPYLKEGWAENDKNGMHFFERRVECKVWSLWRQFYVAASYCEAILNTLWKLYDGRSVSEITRDPIELLGMIEQDACLQGRRRWPHWNLSVRFDELSKSGELPTKDGRRTPDLPKLEMTLESIQSRTKASLRKLQTLVMLNNSSLGA